MLGPHMWDSEAASVPLDFLEKFGGGLGKVPTKAIFHAKGFSFPRSNLEESPEILRKFVVTSLGT